MNKEQQEAAARLEKAIQARNQILKYHKSWAFKPYEKQQRFFDLGLTHRERLLRAGNQQGKSEAGGYEMSVHLTGEYPDEWLGRRFTRPITAWAAGEGALLTRNGPQNKLCGKPGVADQHGTGFIPLEAFADKPSLSRGVTDAYDTIQVVHRTNGVVDGISTCRFLSYDQGREKFQAETVDVIWCDEEPPPDIYSECLARISATNGLVFITFTPLKGMTEVVASFLDGQNPDKADVNMVLEDAKHIPEEQRAKIIAGYRPHEREARVRGIPMLGSGKIFPFSEESLQVVPIDDLPLHWTKLWGIDFGIDHPFAAVLTAWDRDADILYVIDTIRVTDQTPLQHAFAMKQRAASVPVAWPHDGHDRDKGSGHALASQYKAQGLIMLPTHAQFPDGSYSTEAGIAEMQGRMETGRFKVYPHLSDWWDEYRLYHRDNGMIVKKRDDLMSATRMAAISLRFGKNGPIGPKIGRRRGQQFASGLSTDIDPWNGW